jgi:hypothetical protein
MLNVSAFPTERFHMGGESLKEMTRLTTSVTVDALPEKFGVISLIGKTGQSGLREPKT